MEHQLAAPDLTEILQDMNLLDGEWVRVQLSEGGAYTMPAGDHIAAHFVIGGLAQLQADDKGMIAMEAGQTVLLPQGNSHVLRAPDGGQPSRIKYFDEARGNDIPPILRFGTGQSTKAIILSAQLRFKWPNRLPPPAHLPAIMLGKRRYRTDRTAEQTAAMADITAGRPGASISLSRYMQLILIRELCEFLQAHPLLVGGENLLAASLARAIDAVQTRPELQWTVERLARYVGMSRSTFAAKFKDAFDRGPMDMVIEQRMNIAAQYLRNPGMRIKTVAGKVGYKSDTAFLRRFNAHFDMSPSEFRQTISIGAQTR